MDRSINQQIFPNAPHIDPDTRIWCVSFAVRYYNEELKDEVFGYNTSVYTYVCKLPDHPRKFDKPYEDVRIWSKKDWEYKNITVEGTTAKHLKYTKVPKRKNELIRRHPGVSSNILEIPDYKEFLTKVVNVIDNLSNQDPFGEIPMQPIISKGYGNYNYDSLVLKNACNKNGVKFNSSSMISLSDIPNLNSSKQVSAGNRILNQEYLNKGIEHNIDDAVLLNDYIYNNLKSNLSLKQINKAITLKQIEQDFASADTLSQS